jgi:hydroxymethylpyrimidine kinase/phosphomethylpyrimidine kinase
MTAPPALPDVLICAGLDPSGGAGLIADVRVVSELGARAVGVVTALTVQNTTGAIAVEPVAAALVREQLEFLLSDIELKAVKIGMLGASEVAGAIAAALALTAAPVVWDPVVAPSRGEVQLVEGGLAEAVEALAPHVALMTPNAFELELLGGRRIANLDDAIAMGETLAARLGCAVLVKGGHLACGGPSVAAGDAPGEAIDVLCHDGEREVLRGPRFVDGEHVHGTGCALSSAIAAHLARGADLVEACRAAKAFVAARIAAPVRPGRGAAAVV